MESGVFVVHIHIIHSVIIILLLLLLLFGMMDDLKDCTLIFLMKFITTATIGKFGFIISDYY